MARFDANAAVTHHDLQNHGLSLVRKEDPHFKASSGWALRYVMGKKIREIAQKVNINKKNFCAFSRVFL